MSCKYFKYLLFIYVVFLTNHLYATDYRISDGGTHVVSDGDRFFDSGGLNSAYSSYENETIVFEAPPGYDLYIEFSSFRVFNIDVLTISDNNNLVGTYTNYNNPDRIYFSTGIARLNFVSNGWYNDQGWEATIHLIPKTSSIISISDGGSYQVDEAIRFYDSGGQNSNYSNNENQTISFSAPSGYDLVAYFVSYDSEASYDYLKVNDGVSQLANLDDVNDGLEIVSETGSLTFNFKSDQYVNEQGWEAIIYKREKPAVILIEDVEVDEGVGQAAVRVAIDKKMSKDVTFWWSTSDYQASQPDDYSRVGWTEVTIPAGELYIDLNITIVDDNIYEGNESFSVYLQNSVNANIVTDRISCTIIDNESNASIEVDGKIPENTYSANDLVQNVLVTGCLIANDVKYKGDESNGLGFFSKGESDFPLSSGIIMSTGHVGNAEGPASGLSDDENKGFAFDENNKDQDLMTLAGTEYVYKQWWNGYSYYYGWGWDKAYNDAQVLEFDFIPAGDKLEFNYIFASEEYNGYACTDYNDGFAFILSGPGIVNDTGLTGKNIALTEKGDHVTINNVYKNACDNCPDNSEYYVEDIGTYASAFDGRTKVLTAKADVSACETYHIKLVIYDRNDQRYNSAVFLEANSFKSNEVQVDNMIGEITDSQDVMFEGCEGSFMRFIRNADFDIDKEISFKINVTGTANNEPGQAQDYVYTDADGQIKDDGVFPKSIIIPAGETYADYYYKAIDDGKIESDETIIFRIDKCPCDGSEYYEKEISIINAPKVELVASAAIQCVSGENPIATITVQLVDGIDSDNYLYSFDGGITYDTDNVKTIVSKMSDGSDLVGKSFSIIVKDLFSCGNNVLKLTTTIPSISPVVADAGGPRSICEGSGTQLMGKPAPYCEWFCNTPGIIDFLSDMHVSNPRVADDIPVGVYEFTLKVQDKSGLNPTCFDEDKMVLTVLEAPVIESAIADNYELCSGDNTMLRAKVTNMTVSYLWNPSDGLSDKSIANPVFSADVLSKESRSFTLTVESGNKCTAVANLEHAINIYPLPKVDLDEASSSLCSNGSEGKIKVVASGGTPKVAVPSYDYIWSHNAVINSNLATGLTPNTYSVIVHDAKGCEAKLDVQIEAQPKPIGIFFE